MLEVADPVAVGVARILADRIEHIRASGAIRVERVKRPVDAQGLETAQPEAAALEPRGEGGPFASLSDFLCRLGSRALNRKSLESLIKCGALDSTGAQGPSNTNKADRKQGRSKYGAKKS